MERERIIRRRVPLLQPKPVIPGSKPLPPELLKPLYGGKYNEKGGQKGNGGHSNVTKLGLPLKEAILLAAKKLGQDSEGKDGLIGYLMRIGHHYPKEFVGLLEKILPMQIKGQLDQNVNVSVQFRSVVEVQEELKRRGLPDLRIFDQ